MYCAFEGGLISRSMHRLRFESCMSGFKLDIAMCIVVVVLYVLLPSYMHLLYCVCALLVFLFCFTLDAGLLARSQYSEGPATGHLDTGFSWFPCV